jgi:hypothetical protein
MYDTKHRTEHNQFISIYAYKPHKHTHINVLYYTSITYIAIYSQKKQENETKKKKRTQSLK